MSWFTKKGPRREIAGYTFDVPTDFHVVPLGPDAAKDSRPWAVAVAAEARETAEEPGEDRDIVENLVSLRNRLIGRRNPWLSAAVMVRTRGYLSLGCLVTSQQVELGDGDDADAFEAGLRAGIERMTPGVRSRDASFWRERIEVGEVVGMLQTLDYRDPGAEEGRLERRVMAGVFPDGVANMVQYTFTVSDLGALPDLGERAKAIIATTHLDVVEAL